MRNEDSTPHGQHLPCGESSRGENTRVSPTPHQYLVDQRPSSPPTITEHHFGLPSPPRRPTGTFEYGHTYGSSTYRHDQSTFLGTPKLPTRYQPDHASFRQHNRSLHENRRRQFSPFVHFPRYQDKTTQDETGERLGQKGPATPSEENRGREFPVNHDWEDSSPLQEAPQPIVYSACALTIWKTDGFYGFLCDKNTLCSNLHFYADASTVVEEEDGKLLGELPTDRLQRGHRVEIEAEFLESDLSDTDVHHMVHIRKLLKLGTAASLDLVQPQVLIPLAAKKPSQYYRALAESGDLVYIHPSILYASSLIDFMKQHMSNCRPPFVDNALEVLHTNRTIHGDVTVAPRWIGDSIGRLCNFKRVLISCQPYGDSAQGYGTVVEVLSDWSIVLQSHSRSDRVHCSLLSTSPDSKVSFKIGCHVRYTACLDLPNSTYKWRCITIAKTSWGSSNETKIRWEDTKTKGSVTENVSSDLASSKPTAVQETSIMSSWTGPNNTEECSAKREIDIKFNNAALKTKMTPEQPHEKANRKTSPSPPRIVYRPVGFPAEANDPIPICMNENPRKVFKYGDEPPCRFTIPDEVERSHWANFSSLYKSMEDFLLRYKHRREKNVRRMFENASKACKSEKEENEEGGVSFKDKQNADIVDDSSERFQIVGVGDDISKILESPRNPTEPPKKTSPSVKYTDGGWWYRRTRPRVHPTVVVAEFIEKRDVEKDCNEDVNVYRLTKTITIRNSGVFVDDGICTTAPQTVHDSGHSNSIVHQNKEEEANIMSLIRNDEVIRKFFAPLLKDSKKK